VEVGVGRADVIVGGSGNHSTLGNSHK
jgi:hypothetical protein